jgi:hypothetical protein
MNITLPLTSENVLLKTTEQAIFEYYWEPGYVLKQMYESPFREDKKASFNVFPASLGSNNLLWKDFGTGEVGNCFHLVEKLENTNFFGALFLINRDMQLGLDPEQIIDKVQANTHGIQREVTKILQKRAAQSSTNFVVRTKKWDARLLSFWLRYGITEPVLRYYNVNPIYAFSINGKDAVMPSIGYSYAFGYESKVYYKIYQPWNKVKWLCNTNANIIEGYEQLVAENKRHEILFITKSLKDCMCLRMLGFGAVSPQSETTGIGDSFINQIAPYGERLVILFDNDLTGINRAVKLSQELGIPYITLTEAKDTSDHIAKFGQSKTKETIWKLLNQVLVKQ